MSNGLRAFSRKFARIANQINYQREFVSPTCIKILIPGGFPYEAFDQTGLKINSWSLLQIVESCRAFSFWPVAHANQPNESFFDAHQLLMSHFFFIVSVKTTVAKELYQLEMPKYPLEACKSLDYIGSSSSCIKTEIGHPDVPFPYVTSHVQTVLVNPNTRKPVKFPDWWLEKYSVGFTNGKPLHVNNDPEPEGGTNVTKTQVTRRDVDSYGHTNWTSYLRFCEDACALNVLKTKFTHINEDTLNMGIRQFQINYRNESLMGDELDVVTWCDSVSPGEVSSVVKKGKDIISDLQLCYFTDEAY